MRTILALGGGWHAREYAGSETDTIADRMGVRARRATGPEPSEKVWTHILRGDDAGGGHLYGADIEGKTQAPPWWTKNDFNDAIIAVQAEGVRKDREAATLYEGLFNGVIFRVVVTDGQVVTALPLRGDGVTICRDGERVAFPLQSRDRKRYDDLYEPLA